MSLHGVSKVCQEQIQDTECYMLQVYSRFTEGVFKGVLNGIAKVYEVNSTGTEWYTKCLWNSIILMVNQILY